MTWDVVREIALALPGMADAVSYGTPSLKVQGRFLARLREDGASVALRIGFLERQELMEADPEAFFITDHYLNYPAVLVRLAKARRSLLAPILVAAWRRVAPKRMVAGFEAAKARA